MAKQCLLKVSVSFIDTKNRMRFKTASYFLFEIILVDNQKL
jgi:hypothetical protein